MQFEELTFEEAFAELEESLAPYERGQALVACCSRQLDEAELKVRQLVPEGEEVP